MDAQTERELDLFLWDVLAAPGDVRPALPGERCPCGRPAVRIRVTDRGVQGECRDASYTPR